MTAVDQCIGIWHAIAGICRITHAGLKMTLISIGDAQIHTEMHGDGEYVILVAGLGGRGQFWSEQVHALAQRFRVVLYDHRGTGGSTHSKVVYGAAAMAEDLLRLMDALKISRSHIVGHSTGGAIGQHLALSHPDRLTSLVLSASWAGPDDFFTELFRLRREILISCGPAAYLTLGTFLATPGSHLQRHFKSSRQFLEDRLREFPGLEIELGRISTVMSHDLRHQISRIAVPTFVIGAADDLITPIGFSRELAAAIPGARLVELPCGGHFVPRTEPEAYNREILRFLTPVRASGRAAS